MSTHTQDTVADRAAEQLRALGIEVVFGVVGDSISPLLHAMKKGGGPRFIPFRTEGAAALAASAYARVTGQTGVCLADAGPGAAYLINGAYDAFYDSVPLLIITGQSPTCHLDTNYHQTADQGVMFAGCTRLSVTCTDPGSSLKLLRRAVIMANAEGTATHVSLPRDLQIAACEEQVKFLPRGGSPLHVVPPLPDRNTLEEMTRRLAEAERPVIMYGRSARAFAPQLWALAEGLPAPLIPSLPAVGVFPDEKPLVMGPLGDAGTAPARQVMQGADTILTVATSWWPEQYVSKEATVLQIDCRPSRLGVDIPTDWCLLADAGFALREMSKLLPPRDPARADWCQYAVDMHQRWRREPETLDGDRGREALHPARVMKILGETVPDDALITIDVGDCALWFGAHFPARHQEVVVSGMWRAMGSALPAALAARIAQPDRTIVAIAGDAAIAQSIMELTVSTQEDLPIVVVVLDNQRMAIEEHEQIRMGLEPTAVHRRFEMPVSAVAQALGIRGIRVTDPTDLRAALRDAFGRNQTTVLEVPVQADTPPEVRHRIAQPGGVHQRRQLSAPVYRS